VYQIDWLWWSQIAQGIGAICSSAIGGGIAFALYRYTRRRDRLDFLRSRWTEQQNINIHQLESDGDIQLFEQMVYGHDFHSDPASARKRVHCFLVLNMIQHHYFAWTHGIISKAEFESYATTTLSLMHREKTLVDYLLRERGYTPEFRRTINELFGKTRPATPPQHLDAVPYLGGAAKPPSVTPAEVDLLRAQQSL
jgi:hypothetical protein